VQLPGLLGAELGALSMVGDCISSAWKRRMGLPPGRDTMWLDQLPEALLPLAVLRVPLGLAWVQVAGVVAVFTVLNAVSLKARHPHRWSRGC
jgi:hypothetical protein